MSDRAFSRNRAVLQEMGVIKSVDGGYALSNFEFLESEVEGIFSRFLSEQKVVYSAWLVDSTGKPWREIEAVCYKVAKKLGLNILPDGAGKMFLKTH